MLKSELDRRIEKIVKANPEGAKRVGRAIILFTVFVFALGFLAGSIIF